MYAPIFSFFPGSLTKHHWPAGPGAQQPPTTTMAEDADMRNELEEMQRRADQLADEVKDSASEKETSSNVSIF